MLNTSLASGIGPFHSDSGERPRALSNITITQIIERIYSPQEVDKQSAQWVIFSSIATRSAAIQKAKGQYHALWVDFDGDEKKGTSPPVMNDALSAMNDILGEDALFVYYSSKSATLEKQKGRLIIPLADRLSYADYLTASKALHSELSIRGIDADVVTERANQICYLPNKGDFYQYHVTEGKPVDVWTVLSDRIAVIRSEEIETAKLLKTRQQQALQKAQARIVSGTTTSVDVFKQEFSPADMWESYGARRVGNRYISPNSESGTPGISIIENRWVSNHSSDGHIGTATSSGTTGDSFDLYVAFEHNGDFLAAVQAAGELLTTSDGVSLNTANQREYMQQKEKQGNAMATQVSVQSNFWNLSDGTSAIKKVVDNSKIEDKKTRPSEALKLAPQQVPSIPKGIFNTHDPEPEKQAFTMDLNACKLSLDWLNIKPKPRKMLIDKFLSAGITGILSSKGGVGKSMLSLQLAVAISGGKSFFDLPVSENGQVLVLTAEDDREECQRRLYNMAQHAPEHMIDWGINWNTVLENLLIKDLVGTPLLFTNSVSGGTSLITQEVSIMADELNAELDNLKMIIVDTYSRFNGGKENDNNDSAMFIKACEVLGKKTNATVLVLSHNRKGGGSEVDDIGGGGRFVDSSRWAATLSNYIPDDKIDSLGMTPQEAASHVRLKIVKDNYCGKMGLTMFIHREECGIFTEGCPVDLNDRAKSVERKHDNELDTFVPKLLEILNKKENIGKLLSISGIAKSYGGAEGPFAMNRGKVEMFIRRSVSEGFILEKKSTLGRGYTIHPAEENEVETLPNQP